jgi:hypothetical protein
MRDKTKQLNTKGSGSTFEDMYFDNFVGLDCVDVGLNLDVRTGKVLILLLL